MSTHMGLPIHTKSCLDKPNCMPPDAVTAVVVVGGNPGTGKARLFDCLRKGNSSRSTTTKPGEPRPHT